MLYKISLNNIKKSIKDYAIYFFTLILGVAIFYTFNSIESQTVMLNVSKNTHDIIKLLTTVLDGISVFVSFVLGFLIIYATRFLIKRRKKEFGIYMTLGMSKTKISKILVIETIIIGILSLGVGLLVGFVTSQGMSIVVANMFNANMKKFEFVFSTSAMLKTLLYFGIIYILVIIFNTFSVSRCKLIDLINASKKSEQLKVKNIYISILVFLIGCIILGIAYYTVTVNYKVLDTFNSVLTQIGLGCIGTYLVFWGLSGIILKIVMSIKKVYYKGLNSFVLRQLNHSINTTVFSMSVICIMLFFTICILSSALSIRNSMTSTLQKLTPVDFSIEKNLEKDSKSLNEVLKTSKLNVQEDFKDTVYFNVYNNNSVTWETTLGNTVADLQNIYSYLNINTKEELMKLSDYNKVAKLYHNKTYTLKDDEYVVIANYQNMINYRNKSLKAGGKITINGVNYYPKYKTCQDGFIFIAPQQMNTGIFVFNDKVLKDATVNLNYITGNYNKKASYLEKEINSFGKNNYQLGIDVMTKQIIYDSSIGISAAVTFIGLYLGIIFLITSAALLALKELSESSDNKERYNILKKLGTDNSLVNKALFKQILIFFLMPLILALIHCIFGIQVCDYILKTFTNTHLLKSIIMTLIILVVIYGGYFLITYFSSKNIIKEK